MSIPLSYMWQFLLMNLCAERSFKNPDHPPFLLKQSSRSPFVCVCLKSSVSAGLLFGEGRECGLWDQRTWAEAHPQHWQGPWEKSLAASEPPFNQVPALCRKCFVGGSCTRVPCLSPLGACLLGSRPRSVFLPSSSFFRSLPLICPYSSLSSFSSPCLSLPVCVCPAPDPLEARTGTWRLIQGWRPRAEDTPGLGVQRTARACGRFSAAPLSKPVIRNSSEKATLF